MLFNHKLPQCSTIALFNAHACTFIPQKHYPRSGIKRETLKKQPDFKAMESQLLALVSQLLAMKSQLL